MEDVLDACHKILTFYNKEGNKFGGIDSSAGELTQVHVLAQQLLCQFLHVVDFGHRNQGETSQVAVHQHGLGIRIADDSNSAVTLESIYL